MIKSLSFSQEEIIKDIIQLHLGGEDIECDPTYSKGVFYKKINRPKLTFDLYPQDEITVEADCRHLPIGDATLNNIMYDPPFIISNGPSLLVKKEGQNMTSARFGSFKTKDALWQFYGESLEEFNRVLKKGGTLIVKCQDTVSGGKQYMSHVFLINKAEELGFYCKDLFVLGAKNRMTSGKWKNQHHARKHHCFFLIFKKK